VRSVAAWLTLALTLFGVAAVRAQDDAIRLTLDDAVARSIQASHRLAEARARVSVAEAVVSARDAADAPSVSAIAGYTRTNHVDEFVVPSPSGAPRVLYPDVPDNYRTRLDLQWPIYTGGRVDALERAARAEAAAASAGLAGAQADLRLETTRAFWALVTARATTGVLEQAVTRAESQLSDARQRFSAGLVAPNDTASAEAQLSRQQMLLIEARNQREAASADLARLIGVDPSQAIEPVEPLDDLGPPAGQDIPALVASARQSRSEVAALQRQVDAAEAQQAAARAGRHLTVAIVGGVDYANPNPKIFPRAERWQQSWDAGVNATLPLWDGGRTAADVAQAAGAIDAARQRLAEFESTLAVEVRQRALDVQSGRAAVTAADDAVRAAAEARRVVGERYRAGVISQTEVLEAEVALLQAQLDRTRALANVHLAEARLARALGR
jgi:outer membrane protein TolC